MPEPVRRRLLQGQIRKSANRVAWLYEHNIPFHFLPTFARFEALEEVARAPWPENASVELIDTGGFDASEAKKNAFAEHLLRTTYVLCPRGRENYSFRVYEALRFGRVPVIIDTDMVLPGCVDWDEIALVIPGASISEIRERIIADYQGMDERKFCERQQAALKTSAFLDSGVWLVDAIRNSIARFDALPMPPNGG